MLLCYFLPFHEFWNSENTKKLETLKLNSGLLMDLSSMTSHCSQYTASKIYGENLANTRSRSRALYVLHSASCAVCWYVALRFVSVDEDCEYLICIHFLKYPYWFLKGEVVTAKMALNKEQVPSSLASDIGLVYHALNFNSERSKRL